MSSYDDRGVFASGKEWLEGAAEPRQETVTKPFTKTAAKRADKLISGPINNQSR